MATLFYPLAFAQAQITQLVFGFAPQQDIVDFPEETGGDVDQALAVPFLRGMDAVVVTEARLVLRSAPKKLDIERFTVSENGSEGVFLSLHDSARLAKVEISFALPLPPPTARIVVRSATNKGGLTAGTPLFAEPNFGRPGAGTMFNPILGGMSVSNLGGNRRLLTLPSVLGNAWLIQIAHGDTATDLVAFPIKPAITRVVLDAAPRNLSLTLAPDEEAVALWKNPGVLLPEAGDQEISFLPLAQKHLSAALAAANGTTSPTAALPVPLRFHCDSGGAIQIATKSLIAEYQVQPLSAGATQPVTLALRGDFTPLTLSAPARLTPFKSVLRLTLKLLGRELNDASPEPSLDVPSSGLRAGVDHWLAATSAVAPRLGEAVGSIVEVASVRLYLSSIDDAEVVLELRSDVAHSPGAAVAAPQVKKLGAGDSGWIEFELPVALKVVSGNAPIWLTLRTNKGEVRWFTAGALTSSIITTSRVSVDSGATWAAPNPELLAQGGLLSQLFHKIDEQGPQSAPLVRLQRGSSVLQSNLAVGATKKSAREFAVTASTLPSAVHQALAAAGASSAAGRVDSVFLLFSRTALDLVIESLTISYDPSVTVSGPRAAEA